MISEEMIGPRIRQLRIERGMTQEVLGKAAGLTKGHISRIENSPSSPAVSTLMKLARAMGIGVDAIFAENAPDTDYCLVKKPERQVVAHRGSNYGYSYEPLAHRYPNRHMDPYIMKVPAGIKRTSDFSHVGEEMLLMLSGHNLFRLGAREIEMTDGDCIYFNSAIPHSLESMDGREMEYVVVFYSPDGPGEENRAGATTGQR